MEFNDIKKMSAILGSVSTSKLDYTIQILGEVVSPGAYQLNPGIRLNEALLKSLGLTWEGDITDIEIKRKKEIVHCNLFKYKKFGDLNESPFLLDNDIIFVKSIGEKIKKEE